MGGEFFVLDTKAMEWKESVNEKNGKTLYSKTLVKDPDTGMQISITKYPAGFINPLHDHACAHGMLVLEGILHTSQGDYGPGSFLWFPEGMEMWHGGTADQDVQIVFITNKTFTMRFM